MDELSSYPPYGACAPACPRQRKHLVLAAACALGLACAPAITAWAAVKPKPKVNAEIDAAWNARTNARTSAKTNVKTSAKTTVKARVKTAGRHGAKKLARRGVKVARKNARINAKLRPKGGDRIGKEPFGSLPPGPLQIIISTNQQKLHLYSGGVHVADAPVATGVPAHPTPLGVFSIIDKERYHESNIYSGAPMPYMQRITWSGVAMHQGNGVGHPASHGCIRMPEEFAARLWVLRSLGARVVIARPELWPQDFADPHLFVYKEKPPAAVAVAAAPAVDTMKTAGSVDDSRATDAATASIPSMRAGDVSGAGLMRVAKAEAPEDTDEADEDAAAVVPDDAASEIARVLVANPELGRRGAPIAIFVSRKTGRIYVRQHFAPLLDVPIVIEHPDEPLGTHVFTAMDLLADGSTFRWNVISLPAEAANATRKAGDDRRSEKSVLGKREEHAAKASADPPEPHAALARIEIPQGVIDRISELMVPGSSLLISDHDLGDETGEGTDFIVVSH